MVPNRTLVRRIAIGAGALVALLVVAGVVFTATFDVNRYKPQIAGAVQERTGRTLHFDGDLALGLVPRIAVKLPATTLSEPKRDAVFARLQSAEASVALMPLLRRELVVDAVRIDGLQATIVRRKDGSTNIDDLLKPAPGAPAGKGGPAPSSPAATIGAVRLEDANLTFNDQAAGRTVQLEDFDLRAGRYAPDARMPLAASGTVAVEPQALAARVTLQSEIEWDAQGGVRAIRDLALKVDGTLAKQPLALDARAERLLAAHDALEARGVRLVATAPGAGGAPLEVQLTAPRLEAGRAKAAGERIELVLARKGAEPFGAKVSIDGIGGTAAKLEAKSVKLTGTARSGRRTTRFDLATALAANVDERTLRFDRAAGELVVEDPTFGPKPVRLPVTASGAIDGTRETVALQFDARGEGLAARGKVNASGFAAPRIGFDIDAEHIDADRYLLSAAPKEGAPAAKPAAGAAGAATEEKIDLTALNRVNASGNVRVGRLRVKGTDVTELRAALKAADGRMELAPVALRVHGGALNGRLGLDSRGNRVAASGSFNGIQLRRLVSDIAGRAAMEGSASGTFQLASAGPTVTQMKRALDGTLALDVRDGALVGIDLADLIGTASGFLQSRGRQTGALDENRRTPFSQLAASVRIKDGVATNDDLKARSPQLDIAGSGRMDLVSTELDYTLRAQVLAGAGTERGALRSLAGLTVPVRLSGPVEKPSYAVDWGPIAAEALLKRATGGRTDAPAVNQLIEGLGDLFRRKK